MKTYHMESDMTKSGKSANTNKRKPQERAVPNRDEQKGIARPESEARSWATFNKVQSGGMKISAGRKIPSGPVGGNGRKTNLARSS
jgi:hypothetical protein